MRTIAWNCQGLGCSSIIHQLKQLVLEFQLDFVFVVETFQPFDKIKAKIMRMGLDDAVGLNP